MYFDDIIKHNYLKRKYVRYDLKYPTVSSNISRHSNNDLVGLKNMNMIKQQVLLNNKCYEQNKPYTQIWPISMGIYIKTFFDLLPPSHEPPQSVYKPTKYEQYLYGNMLPPSRKRKPDVFDSTSSSAPAHEAKEPIMPMFDFSPTPRQSVKPTKQSTSFNAPVQSVTEMDSESVSTPEKKRKITHKKIQNILSSFVEELKKYIVT